MEACPFCLENNEIEPVLQNEFCYLATTDDPTLLNSVMILPLRHVPTPFELTREEWDATQDMLAHAKDYLDRDKPDGYSIGWNVLETGGQAIPHAHLHVIGRYADEPMAGQGIRYALKQPANQRP
jgi:diadenosine tetraphosphate (Ap4A) HIT family hydrolase